MKDIIKKPYTLVHITSEKSFTRIKNDRKLLVSIHNSKLHKIQWLGNGIYFWDATDDLSIAQGKNIVKGRERKAKCVGIFIRIDADDNNHMNLEKEVWHNKLMDFTKIISPKYNEKLDAYFKIGKSN